jgi:uncharacterized membrane protein
MHKLKTILILICLIFIVSCNSSTYNETSVDVTIPTYTKNIEPIIKENCTSCHNSNIQTPSLTTYTEVKNAASKSKFLCVIQATNCITMPPSGKMSQTNINLISLWISKGYAN